MRRSGLAAAAAMIALTLGSCSSHVAGTANPQPSVDGRTESQQVLDPCALVAEATTRAFGLGAAIAAEDPVVGGSRQCSWRSGKSEGNYHLASLPPRYTLNSVVAGYNDPKPVKVAGHSSLETYFSEVRKDRECILFVEVRTDLLLAFQFEPRDRTLRTSHESMCGKVREFAESVASAL